MQVTVGLFHTDPSELAVLLPLASEFKRRGCNVFTSRDLHTGADVGIYSCGANYLYDKDRMDWHKPNTSVSAICLHDLWQDNGMRHEYFEVDSWHKFDVGLLPGRRWIKIAKQSKLFNIPGPQKGFAIVGWPKSDGYWLNQQKISQTRKALLRKPTVLVACSWTNRQQLLDLKSLIESKEYRVILKIPESRQRFQDSGEPWSQVLNAQQQEFELLQIQALQTPGLVVAKRDSDIYDLLALSDLVLSNGSNVLMEGLAIGKRAISVTDWLHPCGSEGMWNKEPFIDLPGVPQIKSADILSYVALLMNNDSLAPSSQLQEELVDQRFNGTAALRTADVMLHLFNNGSLGDYQIDMSDSDDSYDSLVFQEQLEIRAGLPMQYDVSIPRSELFLKLNQLTQQLAFAQSDISAKSQQLEKQYELNHENQSQILRLRSKLEIFKQRNAKLREEITCVERETFRAANKRIMKRKFQTLKHLLRQR